MRLNLLRPTVTFPEEHIYLETWKFNNPYFYGTSPVINLYNVEILTRIAISELYCSEKEE